MGIPIPRREVEASCQKENKSITLRRIHVASFTFAYIIFLMLTLKIEHIYFIHVPVFQVDGNQLVWACLMDFFCDIRCI